MKLEILVLKDKINGTLITRMMNLLSIHLGKSGNEPTDMEEGYIIEYTELLTVSMIY